MVTTGLHHKLGRGTNRVTSDASDLWVAFRVMRSQRLMRLTRSAGYSGVSVRGITMDRMEIMDIY